MTTVIERRVHRRGTAAAWTAANPVLLAGEVGYETDTHKTKLGDGATDWATLPYDAPNATVLSSTYVARVQTPTPEATAAELFRIQPFTAGSAPFRLLTNSIINTDATYNHAAYLGWNPGTTHNNYVTTKPALALGFEDNYTDAGGTPLHGMEFYLEYCSSSGAVQLFRPFYTRIDTGSGTANNATTHMDIGTDPGLGSFGVYAGLLNPVIFTVTSTQVQATKGFLCSGGSIVIAATNGIGQSGLTLNAGSQSFLEFQSQSTGTRSWLWMADLVGHFQVLDKNSRTHWTMTQGATVTAALTDFASSVKVEGNVGFNNVAPVAQPAAPVTLADVIAVIRGCGLSA